MYRRSEWLESTDCAKQSLARENSGLDWNYVMARRIDRDLHERLLAFSAEQMLPFKDLLPLISSGYFHTAKTLALAADVPDELRATRDWLVSALTEGDDT